MLFFQMHDKGGRHIPGGNLTTAVHTTLSFCTRASRTNMVFTAQGPANANRSKRSNYRRAPPLIGTHPTGVPRS